MAEIKHISLVKGDESFVFQYEEGHESDAVDAFGDQADDDDSNLDWFDSATLRWQLGRRINVY